MQDKKLDQSLGYALARAFRAVNRATNRALAGHGLSSEQAHVLLILWVEGSMKVGELQRILSLSSGTLTGALDRMERAGLLRRLPDPDDRRAFRVEPTPFEDAQRRAVLKALEKLEREAFAALNERERKELLRLLVKIDQSHGNTR
jgi:DNA-binding MarR family transcriptional regulator